MYFALHTAAALGERICTAYQGACGCGRKGSGLDRKCKHNIVRRFLSRQISRCIRPCVDRSEPPATKMSGRECHVRYAQ